jgi:amino acid permease
MLTKESTKTLRATMLLLGTIIGAGIFAVPAMIGLWGIIPSTVAFILLAWMLTTVHLYYGEAILRSKQKGHLIGRATYWLGPWAGRLAGALQSMQVFGSCLAYLILGGVFLSWLCSSLDVSLLIWQCLFWLIGAIIVLFGLKTVSKAEAVLTWSLIAVIVLIILILGVRSQTNLILTMPKYWNGFEPYGVFLFSLLGIVGMSEAAEIVEYHSGSLRKAVVASTITASALTYLYGVTAYLASNGHLTRDASDVIRFLPASIAFIVPLFGFLAVMTSFISSSLDLRNLLQKDAHASKILSWIIALGVPLFLLFVTPRDFMATIGFVGSFFGAGIATIVIWMGARAIERTSKNQKSGRMFLRTQVVPWLITCIFLASGVLWLAMPSI